MNRPTTTHPEAPVTRPACPPWCTHRDLCRGAAFSGPESDVYGTATGVDDQGQARRVSAGLYRDQSTFGRDAISVVVELDHRVDLTVNEAEALVRVLSDLISTAKATEPTWTLPQVKVILGDAYDAFAAAVATGQVPSTLHTHPDRPVTVTCSAVDAWTNGGRMAP